MTVTNTGDVAGKDAVQIYAQAPYTQYDQDNGIEKASVSLVAYDKTKLLEPGESQTLEIAIDPALLATRADATSYLADPDNPSHPLNRGWRREVARLG